MNEMTYNEWLEKELNIYKRENNLLNDKLENITTMFNEVHDNELETREKKNDILKWAYSLEKELHEKNNEIINLKTEIVDHRIKAYRLTKILNETSDYT